jgi:hypothetical protein
VFSVGALALGGLRANAVGAVRIDLGPDALGIELVRVAAFAVGFAPGAVAEPVRVRAPYTAVRGLVREGGLLYLTLDPALFAPHNRFALAGFSEDPAEALVRAFRWRARLRWASALVPVPIGALAGLLVPDALATGVLGRASLAALAAMTAFALLRELMAWNTWGGPIAARLRDAFEAELAERLALVAVPAPRPPPVLARRLSPSRLARRGTAPALAPADAAAQRDAATAAAPSEDAPPLAAAWRVGAVLAIASAIVGVMAFVGRFSAPRPVPPAVDRLESGLAAAARAFTPARCEAPEPERCLCARADSPLWEGGVPRLAVLTFHGDEEASAPLVARLDRSGAPRFDFDLAVVNNGARPVRDVTLTLTFARRTPAGRRVGATDRGLFWEGELAPGAAVKWRVKAPGSELRIDASVRGTLDETGIAPAAPDAFFHLTSSRFRALRIHGALMLAYLRDPRAESAVRALEVQGAADGPLLARIHRAAAPVFMCDVRRTEDRVEACVFNASSKVQSGLVLRHTASGAGSFPVEVDVPVHEGRRVVVAMPEEGGELEIVDPAGGE